MNDYDTKRIEEALEQTVEHRWKIVTPYALSFPGWDDWREALKAKFPIRYFVQEVVAKEFFIDKVWGNIRRPFKDIKRWFMWRFIRKHQYNIIRPSTLKPGYYDPDTRILHACMHELVEYVKTCDAHTNWEEEPWKTARAEMQTVYDWWTNVYPTQEEKFDAANPTPDIPLKELFNNKNENTPEKKEWNRIAALKREAEAEWKKTEDEMLALLIKNRHYMWD